MREAFVDVEISSPLTLGATVVDYDGILGGKANASVCVDVDVDRFRSCFVDKVGKVRRQ